jgi:hypothetical protein
MNDIISTIKEDLIFLKKKNKIVYFTIGTTSGNNSNYLTPIRKFDDAVILGIVTSDLKFLKVVLDYVDRYADFIFVDIEKKLSPVIGEGGKIQSNNYFHIVKQILPERIIYPFMPNNITVQSVWNQVIQDIIDLKNASIFILGLGNIGAKIALQLAESGCKVFVKSRTDSYKVYHTVEALNRIKHAGAIGEISVINSIEKGLLVADLVILSANSENILDKKFTTALKNKHRVIGVSRNNIAQIVLRELSNYLSIDVGIELYLVLKSIVFQYERRSNRKNHGRGFEYVGSGLYDDVSIVYDYEDTQYIGGEFNNGKFIRLSAKELYEIS